MIDWLNWNARALPPHWMDPQGMRNVANDPDHLARQADGFRQFAEYAAKHKKEMREYLKASAIGKIQEQPYF